MKQLILFFVSISLIAGCAKEGESPEPKAKAEWESKVEVGVRPVCEVDTVDYELSAEILAFEFYDRWNASFGFNLATGLLRALGLQFSLSRSKMLSSIEVREALQPENPLVSELGTGLYTDTGFGTGDSKIDLTQLLLGFSFYQKTPLSQVSLRALTDNLTKVKAALNRIDTGWKTRITYRFLADDHYVIPAGSVAGVRLGDQFKIHNVEYAWSGEPCQSQLLFQRKSQKPVAHGVVVQLEKQGSLLAVQRSDDTVIDVGAIVEVDNLPVTAPELARSLKRSVRVKGVSSPPLPVDGGAQVDVAPYVNQQLTSLLGNFGLYPRM